MSGFEIVICMVWNDERTMGSRALQLPSLSGDLAVSAPWCSRRPSTCRKRTFRRYRLRSIEVNALSLRSCQLSQQAWPDPTAHRSVLLRELAITSHDSAFAVIDFPSEDACQTSFSYGKIRLELSNRLTNGTDSLRLRSLHVRRGLRHLNETFQCLDPNPHYFSVMSAFLSKLKLRLLPHYDLLADSPRRRRLIVAASHILPNRV